MISVTFQHFCKALLDIASNAHQYSIMNHFRLKFEEIKMSVIFHNLRDYESYFKMQEIG